MERGIPPTSLPATKMPLPRVRPGKGENYAKVNFKHFQVAGCRSSGFVLMFGTPSKETAPRKNQFVLPGDFGSPWVIFTHLASGKLTWLAGKWPRIEDGKSLFEKWPVSSQPCYSNKSKVLSPMAPAKGNFWRSREDFQQFPREGRLVRRVFCEKSRITQPGSPIPWAPTTIKWWLY